MMNFVLLMVAVVAAAHLWTEAHGFVPLSPPTSMVHLQMIGGNSDLPYGPPPGGDNPTIQNVNSADESDDDNDAGGGATLKGNRFSKYAPDASFSSVRVSDRVRTTILRGSGVGGIRDIDTLRIKIKICTRSKAKNSV